jgi:methionine-rich copper-binding protein CopC
MIDRVRSAVILWLLMNKLFNWTPNNQTVPAAVFVILFFLAGTFSAGAHAQLIKSNPSDRAELQESPTRIELWFNELLDEHFNSIEVIPAAELSAEKHSNFAKGKPKVDVGDRTHLTVPVAEMKPGKYVVQYRVLSRDGHTAPGRITFHIREINT